MECREISRSTRLSRWGTHNSFSNIADGNLNAISTNQYYSMTDQLQLGARYIRIDPVFYFGQLRTCHSSPFFNDQSREGSYLLRSNVTGGDPAQLWTFYLQLVEVEQAFKELKSDLAIRPIYHQTDERIEAHIFVAFLAYCLQVTLKHRLRALAPGLTPRSVLEKMAAIQMVDVYLPTTDGRAVILSRYNRTEADQAILLQRLKMSLPAQPPPRVTATDVAS